MSEVIVKSGGQKRTGWTSVSIFDSLDSLSKAFEIGMTDKPDANDVPRKPVDIEDYEALGANGFVELLLDNERILSGFIDDYLPGYDATSSTIFWSGRSGVADVLDCPYSVAGVESRQFKKQGLLAIARQLVKPFGLSVSVSKDVDLGAEFTETIDAGQPVAEFIDRLARARAILVVSDGDGNLLLTRPGLERCSVDLVYGKNIVAAAASFSVRDIYSSYTVLSQINDPDGNVGAVAASRQKGLASESLLGDRYKPLVIVSDKKASSGECKKIAEFEQRTRNARGRSAVYTVNEWVEDPSAIDSPRWQPGKLIRVRDPKLKIDRDLLITAVQYLQEDTLKQSELSVAPLEGYDMRAELTDKKQDDSNIIKFVESARASNG